MLQSGVPIRARRCLHLFLWLACAAAPAAAAEQTGLGFDFIAPVPSAPPAIDGRPNDPVWSQALAKSGLLRTADGTVTHVAWLAGDEKALYLLLQGSALQPTAPRPRGRHRDDPQIAHDRHVELLVHAPRLGPLRFRINTAGQVLDEQRLDTGPQGHVQWLPHWNAPLVCAARREAGMVHIEVALPWSALGEIGPSPPVLPLRLAAFCPQTAVQSRLRLDRGAGVAFRHRAGIKRVSLAPPSGGKQVFGLTWQWQGQGTAALRLEIAAERIDGRLEPVRPISLRAAHPGRHDQRAALPRTDAVPFHRLQLLLLEKDTVLAQQSCPLPPVTGPVVSERHLATALLDTPATAPVKEAYRRGDAHRGREHLQAALRAAGGGRFRSPGPAPQTLVLPTAPPDWEALLSRPAARRYYRRAANLEALAHWSHAWRRHSDPAILQAAGAYQKTWLLHCQTGAVTPAATALPQRTRRIENLLCALEGLFLQDEAPPRFAVEALQLILSETRAVAAALPDAPPAALPDAVLAMAAVGTRLPLLGESRSWLDRALPRLQAACRQTLLADGTPRDGQCLGASWRALQHLTRLATWLRRRNRMGPDREQALASLVAHHLGYLAAMRRADGTWPGWGGGPRLPAEPLAAAQLHALGAGDETQVALTSQEPPAPRPLLFPAASEVQPGGHFMLRARPVTTGLAVGIDFAPAGARETGGMGALTLDAGGVPVLVDSGVPDATTKPWHTWFLTGSARNTVAVAGLVPTARQRPSPGRTQQWVASRCGGAATGSWALPGGRVLSRTVLVVGPGGGPEAAYVIDRPATPEAEALSVRQRFQCAPGLIPQPAAHGLALPLSAQTTLSLLVPQGAAACTVVRGTRRPQPEGWIWDGTAGLARSAAAIVIHRTVAPETPLVTAWLPTTPRGTPTVVSPHREQALHLFQWPSGWEDNLALSSPAPAPAPRLASDGTLALVRLHRQAPRLVALLKGTRLQHNGLRPLALSLSRRTSLFLSLAEDLTVAAYQGAGEPDLTTLELRLGTGPDARTGRATLVPGRGVHFQLL